MSAWGQLLRSCTFQVSVSCTPASRRPADSLTLSAMPEPFEDALTVLEARDAAEQRAAEGRGVFELTS